MARRPAILWAVVPVRWSYLPSLNPIRPSFPLVSAFFHRVADIGIFAQGRDYLGADVFVRRRVIPYTAHRLRYLDAGKIVRLTVISQDHNAISRPAAHYLILLSVQITTSTVMT